MALTVKEVEHVARLARLDLNQEEKENLADSLTAILAYVDKLNELNTENIEPLAHILPINNVFREDRVVPGPPREELMRGAPLQEEGHYKVPKIM